MISNRQTRSLDTLDNGNSRMLKILLVLLLIPLLAWLGKWLWDGQAQQERVAAAQSYAVVSKAQDALGKSETGQPAQADESRFQQAVSEVVKNHPETSYALFGLMQQASQLAQGGKWPEAEKTLTQAVALPDQDTGLRQLAYLRLARIQWQQGKLQPAKVSLNQVTLPAFAASRDELKGDIAVQENQPAAARTAYQAAWNQLAARHEPRGTLKIKMESLGMMPADILPLTPVSDTAS